MKKTLSILLTSLFLMTYLVIFKSYGRSPEPTCSTNLCKEMKENLKALGAARKAYLPPVRSENNLNAILPPPSPEEIQWARQQAKASNFACLFSMDRSQPLEKRTFLHFLVKAYELMDRNILRTEMCQCFVELKASHSREINGFLKAMHLENRIQPLLREGIPSHSP